MRTFSLIVETENLGMAELTDLEASLNSLKSQSYPIKKLKEVLVVVGNKLSPKIQRHIKAIYPWVRIHTVKGTLDYAKSKMMGAQAATGSVLIFCDCDMRYETGWLLNMVKAFNKYKSGYVISGDTRLITDSSYKMALNTTWMIQLLSDKIDAPVPTTLFPLNNFGIEKKVILKTPIPYKLPLYRNKIPIWEKMLKNEGVKIVRAPGTRGHHAPPGKFLDWFYRMLIYGADFVAMEDFRLTKSKVVEKRNMPGRIKKFLLLTPWKLEQIILNSTKILLEDGSRVKYLPLATLISIANIFIAQLGATIAVFNRDFVFKKINAYEEGHNI